MTLTALVFDGQKAKLFNPSLMIEDGEDRIDLLDYARTLQKNGQLFCPHCLDKFNEKHPICYRNSTEKRVHFAHALKSNGSSVCKAKSVESDKHKSAKAAIYRDFEIKGLGDLSLYKEFRLKDSDAPIRQPDIFVIYPNGTTLAIEVQISPISVFTLMQRSNDIKGHGVDDVRWYLYGKNFNRENRKWCEDNNVECFHLWFDRGESEEDEAKPRWKASEPVSVEETRILPDVKDACDRRDNRFSKKKPSQSTGESNYAIRKAKEKESELCRWFLSCPDLPSPPFKLKKAVTVLNPEFYDVLKEEVQKVLDFNEGKLKARSPRHEAICRDVAALKEIWQMAQYPA